LTDYNKSRLTDLNFRTALLESLDWDEDRSDSLLQYLHESLISNTELPETILVNILDEYGESAHEIIKNIFLEAYIDNGLYVRDGSDNEH